MRVNNSEFQTALDNIEDEHRRNAEDKINSDAANYYKKVVKVNIAWWEDWIASPHNNDTVITISYHQLTKFAAVISSIERERSAYLVDSCKPSAGVGDIIRANTKYDWWKSYFPQDEN